MSDVNTAPPNTPATPAIGYRSPSIAPPARGINVRIVLFIGIILCVVGFPIYHLVRQNLSGGITNHGDYLAVDLKALGFFELSQSNPSMDDIPSKYRALDGKRVGLEGFMYSTTQAGDMISEWQLVYNIQKCCFNGPPKAQERVFAATRKGKLVDYANGMVRMIGTLHVDVKKDTSGAVSTVYTMDVEKIESL